jgi:dolichol-phosphate mannosyltransferase
VKKLVVLPSYNEKENIVALMQALRQQDPQISICVVDDNSPDRTYEFVQKFIKSLSVQVPNPGSAHLILRQKKDGRGGAVREGIQWGLGQGFDTFVEMDCDFSHDPVEIGKGFALLANADVALGCRYPDGIIKGWPLQRRVFSFFANTFARLMISGKIYDYTNGYRFYNLRAAELMVKMPQKNKGYIYLSETLSYFLKAGYQIETFPITFVNRVRGVSNTTLKEVFAAVTGIFRIAWSHHFKKETV